MKKALITGITGQDGSYLAELLLAKGYEVHGLVRREAIEAPEQRLGRINHLRDSIRLHPASLESYPSLFQAVREVGPDECYHLAAQSFVTYSFDDQFPIFNTNIGGTHHLLSALKELAPGCRFYFAGTSEMFGRVPTAPQNEQTAFQPRSAYGITKVAGYHLTCNYRETHGLWAASGILFNHESPRRGFEFVTRKITSTAARIKKGHTAKLHLGNLEARRDWGYAKEYVEAMWRILQQETPRDYVIATGESHSVRDFAQTAFAQAGLDYREHVVIDPQLHRSSENEMLVGDSTRARQELGWEPRVGFEELVRIMVEADLRS